MIALVQVGGLGGKLSPFLFFLAMYRNDIDYFVLLCYNLYIGDKRMTVTFREYEDSKVSFAKRHEGFMQINTSSFADGSYHKEYVANDGKVFFEVNSVEYVETVVNKTKVIVKMFKTEFFDSDDSRSRCFYQQF